MMYADIQLGSSIYYRDKLDVYDSFSMVGSVRLHASQASIDLRLSLEFVSIRMDGTDNNGTIVPSTSLSKLRIEKLTYIMG